MNTETQGVPLEHCIAPCQVAEQYTSVEMKEKPNGGRSAGALLAVSTVIQCLVWTLISQAVNWLIYGSAH